MIRFFNFLEKEEGLVTLEFHAPQKILNNKINVYRHQLQGCNQFNAIENNDAMIDIFLKDLQYYRTVNGVKDPPDFSRECQEYYQLEQVFYVLQSYKDYIKAMKNSILVKMGAFLNKIKKDAIVKNIVDFVNKLIIEEYTKILVRCGCDVCVRGLFCIPDSGLTIKNTSYCCNVCNEIFIVKKKYSGYSHRHLELLMRTATNLNNALFRKYSCSNILSYHFLEMFSSNICKKSVNAITLGDVESNNVLELVEAEDSSNAWLRYEISKDDINWLDGDSFMMTVNNDQLLECRVFGIDSPELSSGLECYSNQGNRNSPKKHGKLNFRYFPGIEAYKYAKRKTNSSNHLTVLLKPNLSGSRRIAKVLLDEQDYAALTLSQGLSFLYPAFETNKEYVKHSYTAQTQQFGLFRLSKRFLKLLLPWDVRSGQVTKDFVKDIPSSTACRYVNLQKSCVRQCKSIPYCCIDTTKSRFDRLVLKQSNIKDAGFGAFSKTPIKKDEIICHYADIPAKENAEDRDYLVETASGEVFDGVYEKQFNFGPLVNDIGFTIFNDNVEKAVAKKDVGMLTMIMKDGIRSSNETNNSKLSKIKNSLVVTATSLIQPGEEIYVAYDLRGYWFPRIRELLDMPEEDVREPFRAVKSLYEKVIALLPEALELIE